MNHFTKDGGPLMDEGAYSDQLNAIREVLQNIESQLKDKNLKPDVRKKLEDMRKMAIETLR